jgi:predicted branched-subunit amino acid permease
MLNCSSMRAAVILSAALLTLGVLLGVIGMTTPFTLPVTQLSLLLVLAGAAVFVVTFLVALLPGVARRLDECQH